MSNIAVPEKYTTPEYLINYFNDQTVKSHQKNELNKARLRKAMKRRERIRAGLMFGGLLVSFCGIAAIETTELTAFPVIACLAGLLMVWISSMILHGDSDV